MKKLLVQVFLFSALLCFASAYLLDEEVEDEEVGNEEIADEPAIDSILETSSNEHEDDEDVYAKQETEELQDPHPWLFRSSRRRRFISQPSFRRISNGGGILNKCKRACRLGTRAINAFCRTIQHMAIRAACWANALIGGNPCINFCNWYFTD